MRAGALGASFDRALARFKLDRWSLLIFGTVFAAMVAWTAYQVTVVRPEQRRADLASSGFRVENGSLVVEWPAERNRRTLLEPVRLEIPAALRPWPQRSSIDLHLVVDLPPWQVLPPIDAETYDGPRLYSAWKTIFGLKPDTMADPKIRADYERWRQWRRTDKLVVLYRDRDLPAEPMEALERIAHASNVQQGSVLEARDGSHVRDGELAGLTRYSRLICYGEGNRQQPDVQAFLRRKAADDPSPAGCVAVRAAALLFRGLGTEDATLIACRSTVDECTAYIQVAGRLAEFPIFVHDLPQWRDTVEPLRAQLRRLVRH